jgi:hypothetical protein
MKESLDSRLSERHAEIEEGEQRRADAYEDDWRERYYEDQYELEHGRFADVDE